MNMRNLISKSAFNDCFKHWKYFLLIFLWSETWTSYVEFTGTSKLNRFLNLVLKQPWEQMTHSMISWGWTNPMWPIPPKKSMSSGKKCNMFSKFWMAPLAHNFDEFSSEKNMFFIWPGVASPSLSVVSHKRNLLISVFLEWCPVRCTFCNHLSEQCPFSMSLPTSQQLIWCSCQCW